MRPNVLKKLLQRHPFAPLRLHLSSNVSFDIHDPELAVVTRSTVELLYPAGNSKNREAIINLLHIIWVEVLDAPA
jgi:hypothetical protein